MTGMAAQADASNRSSVPEVSASVSSSAPWRDSSCLLAVTTGTPGLQGLAQVGRGRLEPAHHLDDHVDIGIREHVLGIGGQLRRPDARPRPVRVTDEDRPDLQAPTGRAGDRRALLGDGPRERLAHGAAAEQADPDRAIR